MRALFATGAADFAFVGAAFLAALGAARFAALAGFAAFDAGLADFAGFAAFGADLAAFGAAFVVLETGFAALEAGLAAFRVGFAALEADLAAFGAGLAAEALADVDFFAVERLAGFDLAGAAFLVLVCGLMIGPPSSEVKYVPRGKYRGYVAGTPHFSFRSGRGSLALARRSARKGWVGTGVSGRFRGP
jgi:hypothetical protein